MSALSPLIEAAMSLRAANPTAWTQFLGALDTRAQELAAQTVAAPRDALPSVQGQAREALAFAKQMHDAPKTAETFKRKNTDVRQQPAAPGGYSFT